MTEQRTPGIGDVVHYVSRGSADGRFPPACRAATITECAVDGLVGLAVHNPSGTFFHSLEMGGVQWAEVGAREGAPGCPDAATHGAPFRYCGCGWSEATVRAGTWHWPAAS